MKKSTYQPIAGLRSLLRLGHLRLIDLTLPLPVLVSKVVATNSLCKIFPFFSIPFDLVADSLD